MIQRNIEKYLRDALEDTPVVLLNGARQTGKTTLVRKIAADFAAAYLTLDDATTLAAAASDPEGFLAGRDGMLVVDEVQKAPDLFPAIKRAVDRDRSPGRFLLTGSANVLMLPQISDFVSIYHFRTISGREVDFVLEDEAGRLVAIEVKAAHRAGKKDFSGILSFAETVPDRFVRGMVLYTGSEAVSFGPNLSALQVHALWS